MPLTYEPIEARTLSSTTPSVVFSNVPQTYTDLVIVVTGRTDHTNGGARGYIRFNSDSGQNYAGTYLQWSDSAAATANDTTETFLTYGRLGNTGFSTAEVNIYNYTNTSIYKSVLTRQSSTDADHSRYLVSVWRNTSAITSITLTADDNYVTGTTINLYGIKAAQ